LQAWKPYVGQAAQVYGQRNKREHTIAATQLNLRPWEAHEVSGFGVVDALPPASAAPETYLLRADGYPVLITKQTELTLEPPLTADTAFRSNVWISFHGSQRADGVVVANQASLRENSVQKKESKLRERTEHDPSTVDLTARRHHSGAPPAGVEHAERCAAGGSAGRQYCLRVGEANPSHLVRNA
jgi:hypothetical protein